MIDTGVPVTGAEAVRAAAGDHPYVRMYVAEQRDILGTTLPGALAWRGTGPWGPIVAGHGDPAGTVGLVLAMERAGLLDGVLHMHLPRPLPPVPGTALIDWQRREDWDYLWTDAPPPAHPAEAEVEAEVTVLDAGAEPEIIALLDAAHPETDVRPGHRRVRRWYGIRRGGLVACAADVSHGVGVLGGVTVARELRGQGLGAALVAAMARRLHAEFGTVALGVYPSNRGAVRLYERLGFTGRLPISTVLLAE